MIVSSPRWLVSRGRLEEAKKSMIYFRGELAKHVECELRDCEHQVNSVYFFWTCKKRSIWFVTFRRVKIRFILLVILLCTFKNMLS
jgi:hypothetical protein